MSDTAIHVVLSLLTQIQDWQISHFFETEVLLIQLNYDNQLAYSVQ